MTNISHKNLNKNAAHIPRFHSNNCEKHQMDWLKNSCPAIACAKLTSQPKLFISPGLYPDIVWFAKISEPLRQHCGFFEDWRNFGNPQNWQVFEAGGGTYFALLVDRFISCTNKIGSSVSQA